MKYGLTDLFITFTNVLSLFNFFFYNSPNAALNCLFKCYDVTITYRPHWQAWLWCVRSASEKKSHCTESSSQFRTFYYCSTIYTSTYNFECINFHIIFLFVCLNVWCGSSSDETWDENINCSCHGCRPKNYYFFHLTKKTGLQVHPTTDMQVTESREEEKTEPSDKRRSSSVCFCYGLTSAGRKTLNVTWMELKSGRWMAEMAKYIYIHILTYMQRWKDECWFE